jgi:hypothetical protein
MSSVSVKKMTVSGPKNRPKTVRAKYNQESILSLFLSDDMNKAGDTGIATERRFYENVLDLTLL